MKGRGPRDLRDVASAFLGRADRTGGRAGARAVALWDETVGPQIASVTHASAVRNRELVVHVGSAVWATELQALSTSLVEALNAAAGEELVRGIRFTVSRAVTQERARLDAEAEREGFYREPKVDPAPLSDEERRRIEAAAAGVDDERLREAMVRAMVADLEWKKAGPGGREGAGQGPDGPLGGETENRG